MEYRRLGKDDGRKIVGVDDYKKLMEDLLNKIRNTMGISAEVNLHEENLPTRLGRNQLLFSSLLNC